MGDDGLASEDTSRWSAGATRPGRAARPARCVERGLHRNLALDNIDDRRLDYRAHRREPNVLGHDNSGQLEQDDLSRHGRNELSRQVHSPRQRHLPPKQGGRDEVRSLYADDCLRRERILDRHPESHSCRVERYAPGEQRGCEFLRFGPRSAGRGVAQRCGSPCWNNRQRRRLVLEHNERCRVREDGILNLDSADKYHRPDWSNRGNRSYGIARPARYTGCYRRYRVARPSGYAGIGLVDWIWFTSGGDWSCWRLLPE